MPPSRRRAAPLVLAAVLGLTPPAAAAFRCDSTTTLTPIAVDTTARRVLFGLPQQSGGASWLLEADLATPSVRAWREEGVPTRFSGSIGPGPLLAASRCGDSCLQVVRFRDGAWEPLGEPLLASQATTVYLTWDRAGAPWTVLHAFAGGTGASATAYRLEGSDWVSKGGLTVHAVGSPGAAPAPTGEDGVTSGDGLFTAGGKPRYWLEGLPAMADSGRGELVWLGGASAMHLGVDGVLRTTGDAGASWQTLRWQPLTAGEGDLAWRPGRDYWIELPEGDRDPPLAAMWTDRRASEEPPLFLATQTTAGPWRTLLRTPQGILTREGDRLPYDQLFRFAGEHWVLATGCVSRQDGAALAMRRFSDGVLGPPEVVAVELPPP